MLDDGHPARIIFSAAEQYRYKKGKKQRVGDKLQFSKSKRRAYLVKVGVGTSVVKFSRHTLWLGRWGLKAGAKTDRSMVDRGQARGIALLK